MPDCTFKCSYCGQIIEAPADMIGQLIDCPSCKKPVEVTLHPATAHTSRPSMPPRTYSRSASMLKQNLKDHAGEPESDVSRRSDWGKQWKTVGIICIVIGAGGFFSSIIDGEFAIAFSFLIGCGAAAFQAFFMSFLVNVFTDIRWFLMQMYKMK